MGKFELYVDDNYHFMNEDERYLHGTYDTYEEAVAAAKKIIDGCLAQGSNEGLTPEGLYAGWAHYGDSPFIVGDVGKACDDEVLERGKAIVEEMKSRIEAHGENLAEMLKPMSLPPLKVFFSASEYAKQRCREICREDNAVASKLRYHKWPEEMAGFTRVLARCMERPDITEKDIEALEKIRETIKQFPKAMPPEPFWYWLRLEDGPVSYTAYFHPDRFELSTDGYEKDVNWKIYYYGNGRRDVRTGGANNMAHILRLMEVSAIFDEDDVSILKVSA